MNELLSSTADVRVIVGFHNYQHQMRRRLDVAETVLRSESRTKPRQPDDFAGLDEAALCEDRLNIPSDRALVARMNRYLASWTPPGGWRNCVLS